MKNKKDMIIAYITYHNEEYKLYYVHVLQSSKPIQQLLNKYYNTQMKMKEIIFNGDIYKLDIHPNPTLSSHSIYNPEYATTIFYLRDTEDKDENKYKTKFQSFNTKKDLLNYIKFLSNTFDIYIYQNETWKKTYK